MMLLMKGLRLKSLIQWYNNIVVSSIRKEDKIDLIFLEKEKNTSLKTKTKDGSA